MSNLKDAFNLAIWEGKADGWFIDIDTNKSIHCDQALIQITRLDHRNFENRFKLVFEEKSFVSILNESQVYASFYNNEAIYKKAGRPSCALLDIALAKGGPEAIAESFYNCMRQHQQPGSQLNWTLTTRAKVAWCLPSLEKCENIIKEALKLYCSGDNVIKGHCTSTFFSSSCTRNYNMSKVVDRVNEDQGRCPFLC